MSTPTNYPAWLESLTSDQLATWRAMIEGAPMPTMEDWAQDQGCSPTNAYRYALLALVGGSEEFGGREHQRWEKAGLDTIMSNGHMEFVNQEPDGFETYKGEWYIADDDTLTIIHGTFGNYNSPGASEYTYATVYATLSGYHDALAEWDGKPEYLEVEDDWEDFETDEGLDSVEKWDRDEQIRKFTPLDEAEDEEERV